MGVFDIAPTLHFVEPGLKISGESGRKFLLILDNAPSDACKLACEHYKTVLHGTVGHVEFQPLCSPDLSPLGFFLWTELKTQLIQHPAPANPSEMRALLTRVCHRTWTGSPWMFAKMGAAWVRRLHACVAAGGGFLNSDPEVAHRAAQRHTS